MRIERRAGVGQPAKKACERLAAQNGTALTEDVERPVDRHDRLVRARGQSTIGRNPARIPGTVEVRADNDVAFATRGTCRRPHIERPRRSYTRSAVSAGSRRGVLWHTARRTGRSDELVRARQKDVQRTRQAVPGSAARMSNVPPASTRGRRSDLPVSGSDRRERIGARGRGRLVRSRCCARGRGSGQRGSCQHRRRKCPSRRAGSQPLAHTILILIHKSFPRSRQHAVTPHLPLACANAGRQDKRSDAHADYSFVDFPARSSRPAPVAAGRPGPPQCIQSNSHAGKYNAKPQDRHGHEFAQARGVITAPGARIRTATMCGDAQGGNG